MANASHKPGSGGKVEYSTVQAAAELVEAMEVAIRNMTAEVKKPVDPDLTGSGRKAELQAIKETALACKELIVERQKLEQLIVDMRQNGEIGEDRDYKSGFAERYSKK